MRGKKKIMKTTKKRWARYALLAGFAERGYPKDSSCHTISKNMMGCKNPRYGYQTTWKQYKYSEEQERRPCKFAVTPHWRSTVLVEYYTQRFHWELGRTGKPIRKKFLLNIQTPSVSGRNQVMRAEEK
jgi:hypothetical protein